MPMSSAVGGFGSASASSSVATTGTSERSGIARKSPTVAGALVESMTATTSWLP